MSADQGSISFINIPVNIRTPGQFIEFDNSRALSGLLGLQQTLLLIGQRLATGETQAGQLARVLSAKGAKEQFGEGSMLAEMAAAAKEANGYTEMWAVALDDDAAGVAATGTIAIGGAPTAAGTLSVMVAGRRVRVGVAADDTATDIGAALAEGLNARGDLPVTAAADTGTVTLTARHKGEVGNYYDLRVNYYLGEKLPAGVTVTITAMHGGTANPELDAALAALADIQFDYIACPYTDAANLTALENELEDRWGPLRQIEGLAFSAHPGTVGELTTLGTSRNSPYVSILETDKGPWPPDLVAAIYAATAAFYLNIDPARPLQTLELEGMLPPAETARLSQAERNLLLHDGISTYTVDSGGKCRMERAVTTYQVNAWDVEDVSYLDINTLATLAYIRNQVRARIAQVYPRHKLADDTANIPPGQAVVRPKDIRDELIALFTSMETAGIVEGLDQFKTDLIVERDPTDNNRVNALIPPDLVGQFRIFAGQIQFRL